MCPSQGGAWVVRTFVLMGWELATEFAARECLRSEKVYRSAKSLHGKVGVKKFAR